MGTINGVEIREPKNINEKMLFSTIIALVEEIEHGKIELTLSVQDSRVLNIKQNIKRSIKLK